MGTIEQIVKGSLMGFMLGVSIVVMLVLGFAALTLIVERIIS